MYQSCKKKSNLTLFYTSLPNQEGLSGGEVGSLDILILKAMIIETRSKKDLMRGGGLCYLHFHRTPHIHCNRFSIFCSAAHCPLSPKDQSPLEQNHFASIYKVLSRWYKRQALIRYLTASRFHWTTKRGINRTVTLLGLIRVWPAWTTSCPVFFSFWCFNLFQWGSSLFSAS